MAKPDLWIRTPGGADVALGGATEEAVEPGEEASQQAALAVGVARLEQQRGERGAERQRVEGRDENRDRDGDGELLIEPAGDAGYGGSGDEDGGENERDGDDGPADLFHRRDGGVARGESLVDVMLDGLDDDDGVVDDQADGEHEAEERERVDREAERGKTMNVPMSETGTASSGMKVARQPCRKR